MEALVNDNTPVLQKLEIAPEKWMDAHGDYLFRFALSRLQDRSSAEDLVQETFSEALRSRQSFQGRASERSWMVGILRHRIVDYIRKRSREKVDHDNGSFEDLSEEYFDDKGSWVLKPSRWGNNPLEVLEKKEFWSVLLQCLSELPRQAADAFVLRELEELPYEDLSETMGISTNNLGVILYRARMRLRGCLEVNWLT
jgi:RNA polymerase sigma-70 factor (ECF subfamily)